MAFQCAPSLAGIKPANLISCDLREHLLLDCELERYNQALNESDIFFHPLCRCNNRLLLLVYRKKTLTCHLHDRRISAYLRQKGYPVEDLTELLSFLEQQILSPADFPHELGILLGYPPVDVEGFRRNGGKRCKLCGYWKVYGDEQRARELFSRYTRCRNALYARIRSGVSIVQLFHAS